MCRDSVNEEHGSSSSSNSVTDGRCSTSAGKLRFLLRAASASCRDEVPLLALPGAAGRAEHVLFEDDGNGPALLALDWPGSGESTCTWPRWSTQGLAKLVQEVLDNFGWLEVVLIGHSLGAMVVAELIAMEKRVVGAVLLAPMPGLAPCLRAGIWPFPLRGIAALLACAASLCNPFALHKASQSDLNHAWLFFGLEPRGSSLHEARRVMQPSHTAPGGIRVWLQRRLGDVAALVAVLTHRMPKQSPVTNSATLVLVWGERDALITAPASRLAAQLWRNNKNAGSLPQTSVSTESGHFLRWGAPDLVKSAIKSVRRAQQHKSLTVEVQKPCA